MRQDVAKDMPGVTRAPAPEKRRAPAGACRWIIDPPLSDERRSRLAWLVRV